MFVSDINNKKKGTRKKNKTEKSYIILGLGVEIP